jgi:Fe2+ or Zn2+ uptake regulation protein
MEKSVESSLFGKVDKIKARGGFSPNYIELAKSFGSDKSFIHYFCSGCGNVFEINRDFARDLAASGEFAIPDEPLKHYIEVTGCHDCDGGKTKPKLEKIPEM